MHSHPALGDCDSNPTPLSATSRAIERWSLDKPRQSVASRVADCQLYGLGAATAAAVFTWPSWWAVALIVAAWVVPALVGAWVSTRPRKPRYRGLIVNLHLEDRP